MRTKGIYRTQTLQPIMIQNRLRSDVQNAVQCPSSFSFLRLRHLLLLNWLRSSNVLALWCEDQVELELLGHIALTLVVLEVDDEIVLDGEDGVGGEPGVILGVDLGNDGLVVWVGHLISWLAICSYNLNRGSYHHVDVGGPHWVSVKELEKLV